MDDTRSVKIIEPNFRRCNTKIAIEDN